MGTPADRFRTVAALVAVAAPCLLFGQSQPESLPAELMSDWPRAHPGGLPFALPDPAALRVAAPEPETDGPPPEDEFSHISIPSLPTRHVGHRSADEWRVGEKSPIEDKGPSSVLDAGQSMLSISNDFRDITVSFEFETDQGQEPLRLVLPPGENESVALEAGSVVVRRECWRSNRTSPPLREVFPALELDEGRKYLIELSDSDEREILRIVDAPLWGSR